MQSIRPQVAFCKSNYLPFFIDFFTSNMRISPVLGRVLISTSFPRARISIIIFISFSPMLLFYHIRRFYLSPHFQQKRQVSPPPLFYIIFRNLSMYREITSLSSRHSESSLMPFSSSVRASMCSSRAASIRLLQSSDLLFLYDCLLSMYSL